MVEPTDVHNSESNYHGDKKDNELNNGINNRIDREIEYVKEYAKQKKYAQYENTKESPLSSSNFNNNNNNNIETQSDVISNNNDNKEWNDKSFIDKAKYLIRSKSSSAKDIFKDTLESTKGWLGIGQHEQQQNEQETNINNNNNK